MSKDDIMSDNAEQEPSVLYHHIKLLHTDVMEVKAALGRLTEAITKLALIEDRQIRAAECIDRAFKAIDGVERRMQDVEKQLPSLNQQSTNTGAWIDKIAWAAMSGITVYLLKVTGVF